MVRKLDSPKVRKSESIFILKARWSEGSIVRNYLYKPTECSMVRKFYGPKFDSPKVPYSEVLMDDLILFLMN